MFRFRSIQALNPRTQNHLKVWLFGLVLLLIAVGAASVDSSDSASAASLETNGDTFQVVEAQDDEDDQVGSVSALDDLEPLIATAAETPEQVPEVETRRATAIPDLSAAPNPSTPSGDTLDSSEWGFWVSADQDNAANIIDGDISTAWSSSAGQARDQFLQIDLGVRQSFDRLVLAVSSDPSFGGPSNYEVFASNKPFEHGEPIASGSGSSLTIVGFEPVHARWIRIVQTDSDPDRPWSVSELVVYASDVPPPPPVVRVVPRPTTTTTTTTTTAPTTTAPTTAAPTTTAPTRTPTTRAPVALATARTPAIRVTTTTAPPRRTTTTTAAPRRTTTTTAPPRTTTTTVPVPVRLPIPDVSTWSFSASDTREAPVLSVDGDIETRWSSRQRQEPGQFFQVNFGTQATFDQLVLALDENDQPNDYPRGYEVYAFDNLNNIGRPIARGSGDVRTIINFEEVTAQYVRIVQTGNDDKYWWSIYELDIN